jgi:hypothetical protein
LYHDVRTAAVKCDVQTEVTRQFVIESVPINMSSGGKSEAIAQTLLLLLMLINMLHIIIILCSSGVAFNASEDGVEELWIQDDGSACVRCEV